MGLAPNEKFVVKLELNAELYGGLRKASEYYGVSIEEYLKGFLGFLEDRKDNRLMNLDREQIIRLVIRKDGEIASLRFQNYELFSDNKILTIKLSACNSMVKMYAEALNKLKQRKEGLEAEAVEGGSNKSGKELVNDADKEFVHKMFSRYLFM
jgi:hypothetical protein